MKLLRFDHMHVKPINFDQFNADFEKIMGIEFFMKQDMTELYGTKVAYEPSPIGVESSIATDAAKSFSAKITDENDGVYCVCYKVECLEEAIREMEELGYKMMEYIDNNPILEAVFDTKKNLGFYLELTEYPFESMRDLATANE